MLLPTRRGGQRTRGRLHRAPRRGLAGGLESRESALAHGADPNPQDDEGHTRTPQSEDFELPDDARPARPPYFLAAKFVEADIMRALAAEGPTAR